MPWFEFTVGRGMIQVQADDADAAREKAIEQLRDVGVLPGPMHDAWKKLCAATR